MKIPFTSEQFFEVFKNYNETIFPMQVIFNLLAVIVVYLAIKNNGISNWIISSVLSLLWLWMGIVYHLLFFSSINKVAYAFGAMFIIQGLMFLLLGTFRNKFSFKVRLNPYGIVGILLIIFSLIIYPIIGYFTGHVYPLSPTFGLPCPTASFTFGMLLFMDKKCPVIMLVIPFIWAIVGVSAAVSLGVYEDIGLLVAALSGATMILIRNKRIQSAKRSITLARTE